MKPILFLRHYRKFKEYLQLRKAWDDYDGVMQGSAEEKVILLAWSKLTKEERATFAEKIFENAVPSFAPGFEDIVLRAWEMHISKTPVDFFVRAAEKFLTEDQQRALALALLNKILKAAQK